MGSNYARTIDINKRSVISRLGDVVAQLVERRPRDPMDSMIRGSNPVRSSRKNCESFFRFKMLC